MSVIDIRGTHGSGKGYVMLRLLEMGNWQPIIGPGQASKGGPVKDRHLGYANKAWKACIIGDYTCSSGFGGGCDLLFPEEVVKRLVRFTQEYQWVLLEGILVAHTFTRYHELAQQLDDYKFCFLTTPLATCCARIRARRAKAVANKDRGFKLDSCRKDFYQIGRVREKCIGAGDQVVDLPYRDPVAKVLELMGRA